jgi:2,4-dienoyl-CoA reductase-like NADH-dependent reductase (Old Yellow Enzyme family)
LGIWKDEHIPKLASITQFVKAQRAIPGMQLAHAGRKASTRVPWEGGTAIPELQGGWRAMAPSPIPFRPEDPVPVEMSKAEIHATIDAFAAAAARAFAAGFQVIEIHGAHGYLIHEFLSPLSNARADEYGGPFENRIRFLFETIAAVRGVWPDTLPLFLRISAQDWAEGGWQLEDSVELARRVGPLGIDLIDCSSGGLVPYAKIQVGPAYQTPFAERIRRETGVRTGAVGMITEAAQADAIIREGRADLVLLARAFLRDPYWALHAAQALGEPVDAPVQYKRAF